MYLKRNILNYIVVKWQPLRRKWDESEIACLLHVVHRNSLSFFIQIKLTMAGDSNSVVPDDK
jgi:hypothetical protein